MYIGRNKQKIIAFKKNISKYKTNGSHKKKFMGAGNKLYNNLLILHEVFDGFYLQVILGGIPGLRCDSIHKTSERP